MLRTDADGTINNLGVRTVNFDSETHKVSVYPNPFVSELNLVLENAEGTVNVVLVDMIGREVYRNNYQATSAPISIQPNVQLAQGVYILQVTSNSVTSQFRVVKQ